MGGRMLRAHVELEQVTMQRVILIDLEVIRPGGHVVKSSGLAHDVLGRCSSTLTVPLVVELVRLDTPVEVDYYRNGGILHTVLREMARA